MPTLTPKLGIRKPLGNETVNRAAFNENWDIIDAGAQKTITQNPTAPLSPVVNDLWIDTSATPQSLRRWNGTTWITIGVINWTDVQNRPTSFTPTNHGNEAHEPDMALASELTTHTALTNTAHGAVSAPTINTLMARDASGRAQVADGVAASDIATKRQTNRTHTFVVAASNSSVNGRSAADWVCDGVDDQVEINAALTALGTVGGCVMLLEGTYTISASINVPSNATLSGQGRGTIIMLRNNHNLSIAVVRNSDSVGGNQHIVLRDFTINGNRANQTAGVQDGAAFTRVVYSQISNVRVINCRSVNIVLAESNFNNVSNCLSIGGVNGILLGANSNSNTVTGNTCQSNLAHGILLGANSNSNTVTGNTCQSNLAQGILLSTNSNSNTVTGNTCTENSHDGIATNTCINNTIAGNVCRGSGYNGIFLVAASNSNTVTGNTCTENLYHGIAISASSHNNIVSGNGCHDNGRWVHNNYSNIIITDNANNNNVQGNICRRGTGANQVAFGIRVNTANCNSNLVTNNDLLTGGAAANFSDAGTGTVTVAGNRI